MDDDQGTLPPTGTGIPGDVSSGDFVLFDPPKIGRYSKLKLLGKGGFGFVYLGLDEDLDRPVAIKVPRAERVSRPSDLEAYLREAQVVASLRHPHIVQVFDLGRTDDGLCFVVSEFMEGGSLAYRIAQARYSFQQSAELVATIAEALHFAHSRGVVHRDVKPANILLDASGKAYLADFGLALKEEDFGRGAGLLGTPAYMSPEQARGEGHQVDGRSDIFSLGVVFYELLTGRLPFIARSADKTEALLELYDLIANTDARPPRMSDVTIPAELERICLKALARRTAERYTTAWDMADDLRHFLSESPIITAPPGEPRSDKPQADLRGTSPAATLEWDPSREVVVPKGLRSYDERDRDFFLRLLPGPRDRHGLPESIRFWKRKIEQIDADSTFKVGLIYGPSGCGKTSFVRAGLLPKIDSKRVSHLYVEATPGETEARLLKSVRKAFPELPGDQGLADALASLRRGHFLPEERKLLIVLDQFEQWLFARSGEENPELVSALRQCDGGRVQAVVLVRDDFWMAATRFMRKLDLRLVEGENSAAVDLFDLLHARRVLVEFGHAYGNLPEEGSQRLPEHEKFLEQAIAGLAQGGRVISVRLSLFADMMKGRAWTPAELQKVGGATGVGKKFLQETLSDSTAPAANRPHRIAAQEVLRALLPLSTADLKGQMRSRQELLEASGYGDRSEDFDALIRILDRDLRLITPTDPEGSTAGTETTVTSGRYFQLTHDYLVHSVRDWLTEEQRGTRRGRAELLLKERSDLWNSKRKNRYLPSAWEWARIRLLTRRRRWSQPERRMMRAAGSLYALRAIGLALILVLGAWCGIEAYGSIHAGGLVHSLRSATIAETPGIVDELSVYRRWADWSLRASLHDEPDGSDLRLKLSLALLPVDASQLDYLFNRLLSAPPVVVRVLRQALERHESGLIPRLWTVLDSVTPDDASLLPSASALALYDPNDKARWDASAGKVAEALVSVNSRDLGLWLDLLRPVRLELNGPLAAIFHDKNRSPSARSLATDILVDYARDDAKLLAQLLLDADPQAYLSLFAGVVAKQEDAIPEFLGELRKTAAYPWNDPSFKPPETLEIEAKNRLESAHGLSNDHFAYCQTMPLADFLITVESLKKSGYRPTRFRPFADGKSTQVAAVWTRDGRPFRLEHGRSAEEIRRQDQKNRGDKFRPVDVAGYLATGINGKPVDRYAAIWVERTGDDDAQLYVGLPFEEEGKAQNRLKDEKLVPRTIHAFVGSGGKSSHCGVWGRPEGPFLQGQVYRDQFEGSFEQDQVTQIELPLRDVTIWGVQSAPSSRARAQSAFELADTALRAKPDDLEARMSRALANLRLGENQKAHDDFLVVIRKNPNAAALEHHIIALARLAKKDEALSELAKFQNTDASEGSRFGLAVVAAAELGEGFDRAFETLEAAIHRQPKDKDVSYDAARCLALASRALSRSDKTKANRLVDRALGLLRDLVRRDGSFFERIDHEPDFDPLREEPRFVELLKDAHPDRRYSAVRSSDASFEAVAVFGLDPAAHVLKVRELIANDFRPLSLSVTRTVPEGPLISASVWYRPVISEEVKDELAKRQARAAIALGRLGKGNEIFVRLQHGSDPRLRSFLVNWLKPMGADASLVAGELDRTESKTEPMLPRGPGRMDAVLYLPETSRKRALILALGSYGMEGLSSREKERQSGILLDLYRRDPDSGVHGAAEWALRKWGQEDQLHSSRAALPRAEDRGERRWFVNSRGQTFAVIDGPVEFRMGSPPSESDRLFSTELPHRRIIRHRFAIADREVTLGQYLEYLKEVPGAGDYEINKLSPDPNGPVNATSWYEAAGYCNWLSRKEGLTECYEPNALGQYAEGMKVPVDALRRSGYRLPTEGEWEFACRAGSHTSRFHGHTEELLSHYSWYAASARLRAWPCGNLMPNDLGLFDMLGNLYEWCQASDVSYEPDRDGTIEEEPTILGEVNSRVSLMLRGGCLLNFPSLLRSAYRIRNNPSYHNTSFGFRVARTLD